MKIIECTHPEGSPCAKCGAEILNGEWSPARGNLLALGPEWIAYCRYCEEFVDNINSHHQIVVRDDRDVLLHIEHTRPETIIGQMNEAVFVAYDDAMSKARLWERSKEACTTLREELERAHAQLKAAGIEPNGPQ